MPKLHRLEIDFRARPDAAENWRGLVLTAPVRGDVEVGDLVIPEKGIGIPKAQLQVIALLPLEGRHVALLSML